MGNTTPILWVLSLIEYLRLGTMGPFGSERVVRGLWFVAFGSWPLVRGLWFVAWIQDLM